jgi:beta-N-acetylhexosaminidase
MLSAAMTLVRELETLAGRVLIGGFHGAKIPDDFRSLVRSGALGGVILFKRNIVDLSQVAELLAELQSIAPRPLWTAIDQEGGRVQRLGAPFPQLPPMRQLGEKRDPALVRRAGAIVAEGLRALGFRQDYAPVLDVDTNPKNPVIGDRSFSRSEDEVAELGIAFAEGLQSNGVAACGKHFPGHGDTSTDSHHELPFLDHDLERLERIELKPFRAACQAGIASIMTAHVMFPVLDKEHPATVSEKIIEPILRKSFGYDGVVVSDDLEMKAISDHYGTEDAVVRSIKAGCDQLLVCHQPALQAAAHRGLVQAIERGDLDRARLEASVRRIEAMEARYPLRPAGADLAATLARLDTSVLG